MSWIGIAITALVAVVLNVFIGMWLYKQVLHRWFTWRSLPRETPYDRRRRRCRIAILEAEDFLEGQYRYFALHHARRAYRLEPTNARALFVLGLAWDARKRPELALKHFEQAYRLIEHEYRATNHHADKIIPEIAIEAARASARLRLDARTELEREDLAEQVLEWASIAVDHDPDEAICLLTDPLLRELRAQVRLMPPYSEQLLEPPR